jgi:hypothetical protein
LSPDRFIGAFVFPEAWRNLAAFRELLALLRDYGVNALLTESESYSAAIIAAAHDHGLRFYAGVACFSDHAAGYRKLSQRPELWPILETGERRPRNEWYIGLIPTDRAHQQSVLTTVATVAKDYPIDGLFLDFIRWPIHWEIELRPDQPRPLDSSFDPQTLRMFEHAAGIQLQLDLGCAGEAAHRIREKHLQQWVAFKRRVITALVNEARDILKAARPQAELGLFTVPDVGGTSEALTGQRIADLAPLVDWVSPMLYHNILLRPQSWIGTAISEIVGTAGAKTLPVLQADSNRDGASDADWGPPMSLSDWERALGQVAFRTDVAGLIVFPGPSLIGDGRGEILRGMTKRHAQHGAG